MIPIMKRENLITVYILSLILTSCDNYLDVEPKGRLIPNTVEDYELLLNSNQVVTSSHENVIFYMNDDFTDIRHPSFPLLPEGSVDLAAFTWQKVIYDEEDDPWLWSWPYSNIFTYNLIIDEIDEAIGEDENLKGAIKAEARVGRAFEYLLLVNCFAKHYDAATASTDPGVPLIVRPDVNAGEPSRASVQAVYDLIIEDLTLAIPDLPSENINRFRATKAAAHGFLARTYLFQGEYEKALEHAESSLSEKNFLADYNSVVTGTPGNDFADRIALEPQYNDEQIYHRFYQGTGGFGGRGFLVPEILALFEPDDLRARITHLTFGGFVPSPVWLSFPLRPNQAVSVPEMYLIRAECNARLENLQAALDDVNLIRRNRIIPSSYAAIVSSDLEVVLQEVLNERRRELIGTGLRWFDLKRLNKEPRFAKTVIHELDGEVYTLEPNGNNYVLPIPPQVLAFNPNMIQNPRD